MLAKLYCIPRKFEQLKANRNFMRNSALEHKHRAPAHARRYFAAPEKFLNVHFIWFIARNNNVFRSRQKCFRNRTGKELRTIKFYEKGILHPLPAAPGGLIQIYNENAISKKAKQNLILSIVFFIATTWRQARRKTSFIDFLQEKTRKKLRYVISIFAIKLFFHTQDWSIEEELRGRRRVKWVCFAVFIKICTFINTISPATVPNRSTRSRICKEIFHQMPQQVQSRRATAECECLDAVQTIPLPAPPSFS